MSAKELIEIVLNQSNSDTKRQKALEALQSHEEREKETKSLIKLFQSEPHNRQKTWIISILAGIHTPESLDFVYETILEGKENVWTRFWAITELERTNAPSLTENLKQLDKDSDRPVKNLVKRILITRGVQDNYLSEMKKDLGDGTELSNSYVLRGLQFQLSTPIPSEIENNLYDTIKGILQNNDALMENRNYAAKVLGNFTHRSREVSQCLCETYQQRISSYVRRSIIDSIIRLKGGCAVNTLLIALKDRDAEIRERAALGLIDVTGDRTNAIQVIVDELLSMSSFEYELVDAIRLISISKATEVIKSCITEDDPLIKEKCLELLTYVGGEEAISTVNEMKTAAVDKYNDILEKTDKDVTKHFNSLMEKAHSAFELNMLMHKIIFTLGVLVLLLGLYTSLSDGSEGVQLYMGLFAVGGGGATVITVFYKGPLDKIKENMTDLLEITILFLGYVRQLNQIDASFKQVFLDQAFNLDLMKETVHQIQETIETTMKAVKEAV